ncbi:MAG: DUF1080 domain-containing protein [Planctomycetia bacterium]|nr:DUF1080 domain-containing protein [Planctomycetia bacterium]
MAKKNLLKVLFVFTGILSILGGFSNEANAFHGRAWRFCCDPCSFSYSPSENIVPSCSVPQESFTERPAPQASMYIHGETVSLFNGKDLAGWRNVKGDKPNPNWTVENGLLFRKANGGDLYSEKKYENFILEFDVKIVKGGNSGVKYKSWNTSGFGLGCEFQVEDVPTGKTAARYRTGGLYDVYEPQTDPSVFRSGEFNHGKIIVIGNHIEHWLNGQKTVSAEIGSYDWFCRIKKSKYADVKEYGMVRYGRLLLQDHGNDVWYKNITITELQPVY